MTFQDAYLAAQDYLDRHVRPDELDEIVLCACDEFRQAWVFGYNARSFLEHGSISDSMVGNGPVVVPKDGRPAWLASSGSPIDEQLN
ncbi:hypothetical protein DSM112329_02889 [Paraconexibacter sp. AEG42_29]|uniref:Immunity protein 35 domain-containing protein n=1 Tax=Paraconexibacter sp. AEG42_29 TaxID=2997339 RepID=A0AAU7AWM0_9ACTN